MNNALTLALGILIGAGAIAAIGVADAQAPERAGPYQIVLQPNYPQAAVWQINTLTGALKFCSFLDRLKCIPVENSSD